jgi:hypothetical protein
MERAMGIEPTSAPWEPPHRVALYALVLIQGLMSRSAEEFEEANGAIRANQKHPGWVLALSLEGIKH